MSSAWVGGSSLPYGREGIIEAPGHDRGSCPGARRPRTAERGAIGTHQQNGNDRDARETPGLSSRSDWTGAVDPAHRCVAGHVCHPPPHAVGTRPRSSHGEAIHLISHSACRRYARAAKQGVLMVAEVPTPLTAHGAGAGRRAVVEVEAAQKSGWRCKTKD